MIFRFAGCFFDYFDNIKGIPIDRYIITLSRSYHFITLKKFMTNNFTQRYKIFLYI